MPECIIEELKYFGDYSVDLAPIKIDGKFGVLVCDKYLYLFSNLNEQPEKYPIINPFTSPNGDVLRPCVSVSFGNSKDHRTPVRFRHHNFLDSTPYFSLLEIDYSQKTARWLHRQSNNLPLEIAYKTGGMGSELWDVFWTGHDYKVFSIGNSSNYQRYGMSNSSLLSVDISGNVTHLDLDIEESCFGNMASDHDNLIITPLYEKKDRKGKQTIFSTLNQIEQSLALPRGFSKFKLHDISQGVFWFSNKPRWSQKGPLSFVTCVPA